MDAISLRSNWGSRQQFHFETKLPELDAAFDTDLRSSDESGQAHK
jgi:hypothetical protein